MSPDPKAVDFDLFVKGVDPDDLQTAAALLGSLPPAKVSQAEDFILNAAWHFLQATEEETGAPSRPALADRLGETIETADKLGKLLNSIGGYVYSIALLHNLLDIEAGDREDIEREALVYNPIEIRNRLDFLIHTLTLVEKGLNKQGLDVGTGRWNWYNFLHGPPKWQLALECYDLFESYRPGEAKSKTGGDFYCFYMAVHGIALSVEPEADGVGARYYVVEVCRIYRELAAIQGPFNRIRRALRAPNLPEKQRRELLKAQDENIQRLCDIKNRYPWP